MAESEPAGLDARLVDKDEQPPALDASKRRRVKNMTATELARKRARDREAQHLRRQRLAQHIESLESTIDAHEEYRKRVVERNQELESTLAQLKAQSAARSQSIKPQISLISKPLVSDKLSAGNELVSDVPQAGQPFQGEWQDYPSYTSVPTDGLVVNPTSLASNVPMSGSSRFFGEQAFVQRERGSSYLNTSPPSSNLDDATSITSDVYRGIRHPNSSLLSGRKKPDTVGPAQTLSALAPVTPGSIPEDSSSAFVSSCWQHQPSVYAWQIPTKLATPTNRVDEMMLSIIQAQRHLARTNNLSGEALVGPAKPDLNVLFGRLSHDHAHPLHSGLTTAFHELNNVVSNFHDRVGGFVATYRLYQWMINPCKSTYDNLFDWQAPRPSQLLHSHPAWMDTPSWGKFKDMLIENQELYATLEFQFDYLSSILLEWPHDPMDAVCIKDGKMIPSPLLEKQLGNQSKIYMSKRFARKYPEFADVCRFEEED